MEATNSAISVRAPEAAVNDFGDLRALDVVLIGRQRDGGQNGDDGDHDHQFDEGETALFLDGAQVVHFLLLVQLSFTKANPGTLQAPSAGYHDASLVPCRRSGCVKSIPSAVRWQVSSFIGPGSLPARNPE